MLKQSSSRIRKSVVLCAQHSQNKYCGRRPLTSCEKEAKGQVSACLLEQVFALMIGQVVKCRCACEYFCRTVKGGAGACPKERAGVRWRLLYHTKNRHPDWLSLLACAQAACEATRGRRFIRKSGRPGSNRRQLAWKARTLPTELLPHSRGARTRTADLLLPKQARYQLRHTPLHGVLYHATRTLSSLSLWLFPLLSPLFHHFGPLLRR